jgi:glycosyltransferase involved in cell wall biosynthesis
MPDSTSPLACICIPAYNAEKTIASTLRSVLGQTYVNLIVLVVDNCSTDGTIAVVNSFSDPRLSLHRNPVNLGGEGNFNRCIALAAGKYTAIYHADDIYEPEMVAKQVGFLETHPQAGAVFTSAILIDGQGRSIGSIRKPAELAACGPLHEFSAVFKAVLKHSNFLICPSVMALTTVYQKEIKCWRGDLFGSSADLDAWLRILQRGPVGILSEATMRYRVSQSQWSAKVRVDTNSADFFSVTDHYLAQPDIRRMLTADDLTNYHRLEQRDKAMRAANALLQDRPEQAMKLCPDIFSISALKAAWQTRRGMIVMVLSIYLKVALRLRLHHIAKAPLIYIKRMANK